ncbi:MAG: ATP-binding protein [Chthoniobacterales bacterium]|nr:ATP-binding protein [Chthoniobacterales bacterium]
MILRPQLLELVQKSLKRSRIVALLGPRQVGKTTLAREIAAKKGGVIFDLEDLTDQARLSLPKQTLEAFQGLIVLDEIQLRPDLLPILRVLADRTKNPARFLILGSASPELIRNASESLAGRIEFIDVSGFQLEEVGVKHQSKLWLRGGFPLSWLAKKDADSLAWRLGFIRTFLERDVRAFGLETSPASLRRLWQMLAHNHGGIWNASEFGRSLGESYKTTRRHLDILSGLFMVRILPPWFENVGKRIVRQPKVYIRDSGLLHALLDIGTSNILNGHPKCGASWEGFCIEQLLSIVGDRNAYFWSTHAGAELDLFVINDGKRYGFEIKHTETPRVTKSMIMAMETLRLDRLDVIYPGKETFLLGEKIVAKPLQVALEEN